MKIQIQPIKSNTSAALSAAFSEVLPRRVILTVRQFNQRNPAFSEAALRNLIFKAADRQSSKGVIPGNGLIETGAIVRVGRKVLIDEARFFQWIDANQGRSV